MPASFAAILFVGSLFSTMMAIRANNAQQLAKSRLQDVIKERDRTHWPLNSNWPNWNANSETA